MADEFDLDLGQEDERVNKVEKRIKDLSNKVELTAKERDELAQTKQALEQEKASLTKEVDFFKNFTPLTSKYQGATEFQDKIREKVLAGYDIEDATISVLTREGKFQGAPAPEIRESPAGGSAVNTIKAEGPKPLNEMSREEMKAALLEAEKKGDLSLG